MTTLRAACLALVLAASTACATEADGPPGGALTAESTTTSERTTQRTTSAPTTTEAPTTTAPPLPGFGAGTQLVGTDVQPGRYTSEGGTTCYWERLSGLSSTFEEIIVNATVEGQAIVEIVAGDAAFSSSGCGRWTVYQAPPSPVTEFGSGDWVVGEQIVRAGTRPTASSATGSGPAGSPTTSARSWPTGCRRGGPWSRSPPATPASPAPAAAPGRPSDLPRVDELVRLRSSVRAAPEQ